MREIKFKLWDGKQGVMYEVAEISFRDGSVTLYAADQEVIEIPLDDNAKLLQYTGLKDKNGRDIYEGDVVSHRGEVLQVIYERASFFAKGIWVDGSDVISVSWWYGEVIGNIYEHSHLLDSGFW